MFLQFSHGLILNLQTNITLNATHTYEIAKYALKQNKYSLSLAWFMATMELNQDPEIIPWEEIEGQIETLVQEVDQPIKK